ncbi:MAG: DUF488 domain-containing protein [Thermodesulfovibrionales bacterium]|nr:DUF488 domain-containing protein [Thermodesulfovibrionales bacterium]
MTIYTIGHSNIDIDKFISLLKGAGIEVLVDVRSVPYSKYANQFNKERLMNAVRTSGIKYIYMGDVIGGMPKNKSYYVNDRIDYHLLKQSKHFQDGINRLLSDIQKYRLAIMCAEEDPMRCHRRHLISKTLHEKGVEILHIRGDGRIERDEFTQTKKQVIPQGVLF